MIRALAAAAIVAATPSVAQAPSAPDQPAAAAPARPSPPRPAAATAREAIVGALDKRTGRSEFFTMKPGQTVAFGPLAIRLATCETTPPWVSPKQSGAFVQVDETLGRAGATRVRRAFSGWLFAESPSLNPMRHPVFDVWLRSCAMSFPEGPAPRASAGSAKKSAPARTAEPSKAT